jgi:RimJ/RimL family protein N-acetyltransferase
LQWRANKRANRLHHEVTRTHLLTDRLELTRADVAWVVGTSWQGQGFATGAARAKCTWLTSRDSSHITAHIHPDHAASARDAKAIGLRPTAEVDSDGEVVWASLRD